MYKFISLTVIFLLCSSLTIPQSLKNEISDFNPSEKYEQVPVNWIPTIDFAGNWCPAGTFPNVPVASIHAASKWLGDTLYFQATTATGLPSTFVYKYTFGGTWTAGVPTPVALGAAAMVTAGGKLYLLGGGTTAVTTGTTTALSYDPGTGVWTSIAPLPVALSGHGAVAWGDSVIFVFGGPWTGSATNLNVYYYRIATNTWGTITNSLPAGMGRRTFAYGIVDGNKIIMCAGYNTAFLKTLLVGNIGSNASQITWAMGPDVPTTYTGLSRPGGTGIDKYFFCVGGERAGGGYHDRAYVYDVTTNAWIDDIGPKPVPCSNIYGQVTSSAFDDSVRVFAPGAYDGTYRTEFDAIACGALYVIPVELTSFTATSFDDDVILNWRTSTETNNSGFQVERNSGAVYESIGFVPGVGTTTEPQLYSYTDAGLKSGQYSYRLKQIDYDGSYSYSSIVSVEVTIPSQFSLEQNYPNPFNPSTKIAFSLAVDSKVNLKIYNALGQEVAILISENMSEGFHEINFNAVNLNSGVYFYKIEATGTDGQSFSKVRKMILTK